jgi:NAD(P)-dependent dehydrogenase (short-subunit alcohol dehydrogenase family)
VAAATDIVQLRQVLAAHIDGGPRAVDAEAKAILAAREIRSTLDGIRAAGGSAEYRSVDVRDPRAMQRLVEGIYRDRGRIHGVIHGAGVLEDRRLADKTVESFARVFETKVTGARSLLAALSAPLDFLVLFGSVSGVFGNRGQIDYSAANDALAAFGRSLDCSAATRVVTVHWGPWGGGGMVSAELEGEFARRGIGLLHPDDAIDRLIDELRPDAEEPEIILMRARPDQFGWRAAPWPGSVSNNSDGPTRSGQPTVEVGVGR